MESIFRLNDVFWTIQGEGQHSGRRALFIRLPFCNYNCPWCDTSYNTYEEWEAWELADFMDKEKSKFAVITGGEPLMNKQTQMLVEFLKIKKFEVACETNGSMPAIEGIDFVTCSPKKYSKGLPEYFINPAIRNKVHEYKYVVDSEFDFSVLDRHKDDTCRLTLSPEWNQFDANIQKILKYVEENPRWRISLQTHKFMKVP